MIRNSILIFLLGAGLWACSDVYTITAVDTTQPVDATFSSTAGIDSMVAPYQKELSATMDEVIAFAPEDFTKGRPNGALNNWAADAMIMHELRAHAMDSIAYQRVICLLNVGGLRNPISKGDVTIGDIYKLMPFDNEVVWVELPWEANTEIAQYLMKSGGEPISGARLVKDTLIFDNLEQPAESFWVITSDYLMNGGDKMDFFEKKVGFSYGSGLMRDAMIEEARYQDTLEFKNDNRIQL